MTQKHAQSLVNFSISPISSKDAKPVDGSASAAQGLEIGNKTDEAEEIQAVPDVPE